MASFSPPGEGSAIRSIGVRQLGAEMTIEIVINHTEIGTVIPQVIGCARSPGWSQSNSTTVAASPCRLEATHTRLWWVFQQWPVTQRAIGCWHFHMPRLADVPQKHVGHGAMNNAVPVDAVSSTVARLSTECIVKVQNVEPVVGHNLTPTPTGTTIYTNLSTLGCRKLLINYSTTCLKNCLSSWPIKFKLN